jgi:hypothetical protein
LAFSNPKGKIKFHFVFSGFRQSRSGTAFQRRYIPSTHAAAAAEHAGHKKRSPRDFIANRSPYHAATAAATAQGEEKTQIYTRGTSSPCTG